MVAVVLARHEVQRFVLDLAMAIAATERGEVLSEPAAEALGRWGKLLTARLNGQPGWSIN